VTGIVASRATMTEMIDKVSMTRYSCFCGFHSTWLLLAGSISSGTETEGFSSAEGSAEMGVDSSSGIAIASRAEAFSNIFGKSGITMRKENESQCCRW
jgi:hypothetical protein